MHPSLSLKNDDIKKPVAKGFGDGDPIWSRSTFRDVNSGQIDQIYFGNMFFISLKHYNSQKKLVVIMIRDDIYLVLVIPGDH